MKDPILFYMVMIPVAGLLWCALGAMIYAIVLAIKERRP